MDIVRTGIGLSKTIKNVSRFREIITVFWKNGFDEFIIKTNLHNLVPGFVLPKKRFDNIERNDTNSFWSSLGLRLRLSFEELGSGFIKLGQLLASREDILHPDLVFELKKLQSNVRPIDFNVAKKEIEKTLGKKIEDVFASFDERPIGVASIGVVYSAKLISGEDVVVKLRRPHVEETIDNDFQIITFLIAQAEKISEDIKYLAISKAVDDFFKSIYLEFNFLLEVRNCKKLGENLQKVDNENLFKLPHFYEKYLFKNLIVMEKLKGKSFNSITDIKNLDAEIEQKLIKAVGIFVHTILSDGFFHADLHGGNFFLMDDGKIGLIDFGLVGNLTRKNRTNLVAILYGLFTSNYENLVYEFLDVADYEVIPDHKSLERDIRDALAPFIGMSAKDMDMTAFVQAIILTLGKHQIYLPRDWFIIFRALMTLDGVGKDLGIDVNIFDVLNGQLDKIMRVLVSKESLMEDAVWIGRDTINSLRVVPRHIKWILKEFSKNKYVIDVKLQGIQSDIKLISKGLYFLGMSILSAIFILCGVFLVKDHNYSRLESIPIIVWILWGGGLLTFLLGYSKIKKFN